MDARNTKTSLSLLYSEIEALIWEMENMRNLKKVSCDVCKRLFTVGEDDFGTRRMVGLQHFSKTSRNQKRASITQS